MEPLHPHTRVEAVDLPCQGSAFLKATTRATKRNPLVVSSRLPVNLSPNAAAPPWTMLTAGAPVFQRWSASWWGAALS